METFLQALLRFIVPFFAAVSMVSAGLGRSVDDVVRPLRRPVALGRALIANFVLVPILGYALTRVLKLERPHAIGLFLISSAAGAAFFIALVRVARLRVSRATGLLVSLLIVTMVTMPLMVPWVMPWAEVNAIEIAQPLLLTMFLPLFAGIALHAAAPHWTPILQRVCVPAARVSLIILFAATLMLHIPSVIGMIGSGALAGAFLLTLGAVVIGYTLAGGSSEQRAVLALGTGQRNIAAALVVAPRASHGSDEPLVMVVVCSLVAFLVLFPAAYLFRRRGTERSKGGTEALESSGRGPVGAPSERPT